MDIQAYMLDLGRAARAASRQLARTDTAQKNRALLAIADALQRDSDALVAANQADLAAARDAAGLEPAMLDRLTLSARAWRKWLKACARLPPCRPGGRNGRVCHRPSGIQLGKMRVPLGVIGIIYEARPNVTADAAGLCLKSGNACILRGGSEAIHSRPSPPACTKACAGRPAGRRVQVINTTDRATVGALVTMTEFVDVIVPRGGKGLIPRVGRARVPVIKHLDGNCHVYVDVDADLVKAGRIADNAKTQRYGTCNTMETLLTHHTVAAEFLPVIAAIYLSKGVELRGCPRAQEIIGAQVKPASEDDWFTGIRRADCR